MRRWRRRAKAPTLPSYPGWNGLLAELHGELLALHRDLRYLDVKAKFGELRVYTDYDRRDPAVLALTKAYTKRSTAICEQCGAPGAPVQLPQGFVHTLCPTHTT